MNNALQQDACDVIGIARPFCIDPDIANKLLNESISETPTLEKTMQIGPGWLGLNSPFSVIKGVNGWGQQAFWCLNLIRMGEGLNPDLNLGVFRAFLQYQKNEKERAYNFLRKSRLDANDSPLFSFILAKIAQRAGKNEEALSYLNKSPDRPDIKEFPYLDYLRGLCLLRKLDPEADKFFLKFLTLDAHCEFL